MIAAELARRLGADLRLESSDEIWEEIEELAPSPRGHHPRPAPLHRRGGRRGRPAAPPRRSRRTEVDDEGVAVGGTDVSVTGGPSTDDAGRGARPMPPRPRPEPRPPTTPRRPRPTRPRPPSTPSAAAEAEDGEADGRRRRGCGGGAAPAPAGSGKPDPIALRGHRRTRRRARRAVDAYSLRLVTTRKLYDRGTLVQHSPLARRPGRHDRAARATRPTSTGSASPPARPSGPTTARGSHAVEVVPDPDVPCGAPRRRRSTSAASPPPS